MISTAIVGYGLAARVFHAPLIRRQPGLRLHGIVARDPHARAEAEHTWGVKGYAGLGAVLADPAVDLVVVATPHDTHAGMCLEILGAGKHCVVDKVMALAAAEASRMIAARDASGRMLSVFHNRRWDWDYLTVRDLLARRELGRPLLIRSSVCRFAAPRTWRGSRRSAGTILHDWGAHLVDQALQLGLGPCRRLACWLTPAIWPGVDSGGHGRIVLEFDHDVVVEVETSRISRVDRPRWSILGTEGELVQYGIDPQEDALRAGDLTAAAEPDGHRALLRKEQDGRVVDRTIPTLRGSWDAYYANVAAHLNGGEPLAVTAEQAREVVRVLDAALRSAAARAIVEGPWGADVSTIV